MANDIYSDALEQLTPATTPAPPPNPYDDILKQMDVGREQRVRTVAIQAGQTPPDRAAETLRLSRELGVPAAVVERNYDAMQRRARVDQVAKVATEAPRVAEWLGQDGHNMAVAQDDLSSLSTIDRVLYRVGNALSAAPAGVMSFAGNMWSQIRMAAEILDVPAPATSRRMIGQLPGGAIRAPEVTTLTASEEAAFQQWVAANKITDVDHPDSHYDYRGYFKAHGAAPMQFGVDHFPDTYKQHGHPTFSVESKYATGPMDAGHWEGETFIPAPPSLLSRVATFAAESAAVGTTLAETIRGPQTGAGFIERQVYGGIESVGAMVPALVLGLVAGPEAALGVMGASTSGGAYQQARGQGVGVDKASLFAGVQGVVEIATEFIPAHRLLGDVAKRTPFLQTLARQMASEIPGEEVATALQDLNEWAMLPANKDRTFGDYLRERPSAAAATLISTIVATGLQTSGTHATVTLVEKLGGVAQQSKTLQRSPEAIENFVEHIVQGGDGRTPSTLYAPIDTWNSYWQSKGVDPAVMAQQVTGSREVYQEALATGADLPIPIARYTSQLAATEHNAFFAGELRIDPDQMNGRELEAQLQAATTEAATQPSVASPVRTAVLAQLESAGVPRETAESYATLYESAFTTLATRAGVDPSALFNVYGLTIARPDLPTPTPTPGQTPAPARQGEAQAAPPDLATEVAVLVDRASQAAPAAQTGELTDLAGRPIAGSSEPTPSLGLGAPVTPQEEQRLPTRTYRPAGMSDAEFAALSARSERAVTKARELGAAEAAQDAAAVAAAQRQAAGEVDTVASDVQTEVNDAGQVIESGHADRLRRARERGIPASHPRERETGAQREVRRTEHYAAAFADLLDAAHELDPSAVEADLRAEFDFRVEALESRLQDERDSGHDARDLLTAIAKYGGINTEESTFPGEVRWLRDGSKFGRIAGVQKVFQKSGLSVDEMVTSLQQDARFQWIENPNMLIDAIDDAIRNPPGLDILPGSGELWLNVGLDPTVAWWTDPWRPSLLEATTDAVEPTGAADTSFNVDEFFQSLFDEVGPPQVDTLDTGEQQPRLPGDAGAVRDTNVATPQLEAPFSLVAETPKAAKGKQSTLFQEKRGAIRFGPSRQVNIALLERADLSTFLHESGHFFLEVFTDLANQIAAIDPAARTEQQQHLLADHAETMAWLADEDHTGAGFSTKQHEQFARGFEAYLMEGKAPSLALHTTFARFRAWLIGIYRSLKGLSVTLSPEVRTVMDRLLASDQAIADVEAQRGIPQMFLTAEAASMSEGEFGLYTRTVADASKTAREQLDRQLLAEVQREQTAAWKAQRAEVKTAVEAEIHQAPVYRALAAILKGTQPNGEPLVEGADTPAMKLSRPVIVDRFGEARVKRLPRGLTAEDGIDPDTVAEMFGFSSGDAMLNALERAEPMKAVIEAETSHRMIEQHGSLLLDGTLHEKAKAAVANEDRDAVIRAELRALTRLRRTVDPFIQQEREAGRLTAKDEAAEREYERRWFEAEAKLRIAIAEGHKQAEIDALERELRALRSQARGGAAVIRAAIPPAAVMRDAAESRVAAMRIRDVKPQVFWSASRRAAQKAIELAARQDFDGAIVAKQQELINLQLYRQAERALEDIETRVRFAKDLSRTPARQALGLAGSTYLDQVDGILDRFEFAHVPQKVLERRASLRDWAEALEAQGLPVDLPDHLLNEARRQNYQELTVEELRGVTDGLKQIQHLARLKNRLLKSADKRDFDAVRDGVVDSIREHNDARKLPLEFRPADEKIRRVAAWFASHTKIAILARALDGHQDGGAMWDAIIRPINAAADAEVTRKQAAGKAYSAILERYYPGRELGKWNEKLEIPAIKGSLSKEGRIAVALNWGNRTSRERLLADPTRKWTGPQVQAILDTLDARDWQFIQSTWDYLNTFWPEIAAKQERLTGLAPEKVEALPIVTRFGDFTGGYYPLAYDGRLAPRAEQLAAASDAKLAVSAAYVASTTKRGHTKTRLENVHLPVRLELGVAFQHLEQVIHDLTHHEMLIDTTRLIRDPSITAALLETKGDIVHQQFTSALRDIALGTGPPARNVLDHAATFMRTGTQLSSLGWNLWTAAQQPLGLFNGMSRVGPVWVARGMKRWLRDAASMENTTTWIADVSPMMRARSSTATQDLADLKATLRQPGGWFDTLVRTVSADHVTQQTITDSYLWHIGLMQRVADVPTWLGAYEKAMAAGGAQADEARAIALADQAVLDSQGGGQIKDLAQVQRGGSVARLFMTFYSYGNTVFNATADVAGATHFKSPASVATFLGHLSLLYVMPSIATIALSRLFGKSGGGDDDPERFLEDVGREVLSTALNTMVLARELGGLVTSGTRGYAGPAGTRTLELFYNVFKQVKQGEIDEALVKSLNAAAGVLFRYPALQVQRTVDGWIALEEGRTTNPLALFFGGPPKGNVRK